MTLASLKFTFVSCLLLLTHGLIFETPNFLESTPFLKGLPAQTFQPFPEYVGNLSYPCETHNITTSDGYINTFFRIQAKGSQIQSDLPVVYLQHGLVDSSDTWIVNEEDQAPGFLLANAGYDVWVGNTRGNIYSLGHVSQNSSNSSSTYWDFSWQEMSLYDLPAAFEYISGATGKNITYIGHSQGTSIMFAALIRHDPVVLKYLKRYVALAPVVYVDNVGSPDIDFITKHKLDRILNVFDLKKFLFLSHSVRETLAFVCEYADLACIEQIRLISDTQPDLDNVDRMDVILGHFPGGTSVQNFDYWVQMLKSDVFKMFDYGAAGNQEHYGQSTPPVYDLAQIDIPVYMYAGIYDELAYLNSTETVRDQLTGSPKVVFKTYPLGHATFIWGKNVTGYFDDVLETIKND